MLYEVITVLGAQSILAGDNKACLVGGMENMSLAPYLLVITSYSIHYTKLYDGENSFSYQVRYGGDSLVPVQFVELALEATK